MRVRLAALVLAVSVTGAPSCTPTAPTAPGGDVLLITVDTLRADHVGLYGYERDTTPHIDRWFADGAIYEHAYSTEANTSPSVVSLLSGRLPQDHGVRLLYQLVDPDLPLLTELLPERYQRAAFVSNVVLTDEAIGLASRFDHYDDFVSEREAHRNVYERSAGPTTDAVLAWLAAHRDPGRPLFLWVHYIDPHGPYRPPPSWKRRFRHPKPRRIDPSRLIEYQREPGVTDGLEYVDRYDEEIAYTDREIGRLLEGYAATRPVDEALVVLTADHGESMMEHERWFRHGYHVYEEIMRVPLLLRGPGVVEGRHAAPASGIDVAPTVLAFAGVPRPDDMADVDLRTGAGIDDARPVFLEATRGGQKHRRAVVAGRRKWMAEVWGPARFLTEKRAYDLAADPGERRPQRWRSAEGAAAELVRKSRTDPDPAGVPERYAEGVQITAPKVAPGIDDDAKARLRGLGYVE